MPDFTYTALDDRGQATRGVISAAGRAAAIEQVETRGLHPVSIEPRPERVGLDWKQINPLARSGRVARSAVEAFSRELANLLTAGVPLSRALAILSREASAPAAARQWSEVRDDVMDGASLAAAMARFPATFTPVNVAMVRAGEAGGFLAAVLSQIAEFSEREHDLKSRVRAAMIYPLVLTVLMIAVLIFLLTYFIPRFTMIFEGFGGALPALTRGIVAASELAVSYGLFFAGAVVVGGVLIRRATMSEAGRRTTERLVLRTPAVGTVAARFALVRFCRMLGTLIGSGVPLVTALRTAREALGNQTLSDAVGRAIEQVQAGEPLARSLAECPELFPPSMIEMVAIAEETGRLDEQLVRLAANYETELDRRLRTLVSLAEPLLLLVMAALVGIIVVGMLLPVFTLQDLIN